MYIFCYSCWHVCPLVQELLILSGGEGATGSQGGRRGAGTRRHTLGPAAAAAALAAGTLHAASAAAHHGGPGHAGASAVSASTSPQPPLLGGVSSSIQVWPLTRFLYFYIIDLPRGQINDPFSGKILFSCTSSSNSLVSVSYPRRVF